MPTDDATILPVLREIQAESKLERLEIKTGLVEIKTELRAINSRVRDNEVGLARVEGLTPRVTQVEIDLARVKERQTITTIMSNVFTVAASAIATWLGTRP